MKNSQPLFDLTTHYRIHVQGGVDVEWLRNFDSTADLTVDKAGQTEDITVINVRTDQAGMVGLVLRLHGLRMTILQLQIVMVGREN